MTTLLSNEQEQGFISHLEELRNRVFIALVAVTVGAVIGWIVFPWAYTLLAGPLLSIVHARGGQIMTLQPAEAFFTQGKLAVAIGLAIASPIIVWQLWLFVRPGLKKDEQRVIAPLMPAISVLFLAGVTVAHFMLPNIARFFISFVPAGVNPNMGYQDSINFPLKLMLTFGLAFQLPIVLLGLIALRVLTPQLLLAQWRTAVVAVAMLAAIITPDPFNMSILMVPLLILYFGTVLVAFWLTKSRPAKQVAVNEEPPITK
ncbi:MAG TPA: twin-arginine translocase subunit TatC [Armatimonadota bacterium]|jgi:sec-independent protein translocase protein TatC